MQLNLDRVRENVRNATMEDLLDRATIYRAEMEPAALPVIDAELASRGITVEQVEAHLQARRAALTRQDGTAIKCNFCWKPAIVQGWAWHRLFGKIPIFPRMFAWCAEHLPSHKREMLHPDEPMSPQRQQGI